MDGSCDVFTPFCIEIVNSKDWGVVKSDCPNFFVQFDILCLINEPFCAIIVCEVGFGNFEADLIVVYLRQISYSMRHARSRWTSFCYAVANSLSR